MFLHKEQAQAEYHLYQSATFCLSEVMKCPTRNAMISPSLTRRRFLLGVMASSAAPALLSAPSPNEKLNLAIIACGGRGGANLHSVSSENIVALCDVNQAALEAAAVKHPKARKYQDFRKLYDEAKDIDAVVVSTPEHTHAFATL